MEVKYQKQLKYQIENSLTPWPLRGISEEQITILETEMCSSTNSTFPKSLKEFLHLAGASFYNFNPGIQLFNNYNSKDINVLMNVHRTWKKFYKDETEVLGSESNWSVDPFQGRPYWGFYPTDGAMSFMFIFLDEGLNDPPVWRFDINLNKCNIIDPNYDFFDLVTDHLSQFIGEWIPNY